MIGFSINAARTFGYLCERTAIDFTPHDINKAQFQKY